MGWPLVLLWTRNIVYWTLYTVHCTVYSTVHLDGNLSGTRKNETKFTKNIRITYNTIYYTIFSSCSCCDNNELMMRMMVVLVVVVVSYLPPSLHTSSFCSPLPLIYSTTRYVKFQKRDGVTNRQIVQIKATLVNTNRPKRSDSKTAAFDGGISCYQCFCFLNYGLINLCFKTSSS